LPSVLERRRFVRLPLSLRVEFVTAAPETGELRRGQGIMRDVSLGGLAFDCEPGHALALGQVLSLSIALPLAHEDLPGTSHLSAKGQVVRLEAPEYLPGAAAVAVTFLADPLLGGPLPEHP